MTFFDRIEYKTKNQMKFFYRSPFLSFFFLICSVFFFSLLTLFHQQIVIFFDIVSHFANTLKIHCLSLYIYIFC